MNSIHSWSAKNCSRWALSKSKRDEDVERDEERRQRGGDADRLDRLLVAAVDEEQREHADERQEHGDRQPDRVVGHCLDGHERFVLTR